MTSLRTTISAAALAGLAMSPATLTHAASDGRPELRIVGEPVVVYSRDATGQPEYAAYVRLNRRIPRQSGAGALATIRVGGFGAAAAPTGSATGFFSQRSSRGRYCYGQSFAVFNTNDLPEALARPRRGQRVLFEVLVRGVDTPVRRSARLQWKQGRELGDLEFSRQMNCLAS